MDIKKIANDLTQEETKKLLVELSRKFDRNFDDAIANDYSDLAMMWNNARVNMMETRDNIHFSEVGLYNQ
jgi:hypothetical protein